MRILICVALTIAISIIAHAQILSGDEKFPFLHQIHWDMSKAEILEACIANGMTAGGNDTMVTFEKRFFDVDAKTFVRFKSKTQKPWVIEVKFKEMSEKLVDTLVSHFTRTSGKLPVKVEKEKSVLLFTMRMEIAAWKIKEDKVVVIVGRRGKSIFDINLSIQPAKL